MATSPVTSIVCGSCAHPVDSTQRFCGKCGASLWAPCPSCKEEVPIGESFCSKCGANLNLLKQQRLNDVEIRLQKAAQLQAEHRYDEAVQQLRMVADTKEEYLIAYQQQATERIEQLTATRDRLTAGAATAYQAASKYIEQQSYEKALSLLEVTPEPMRNDAFQQLHQECLAFCQEVQELNHDIRECVANKEFIDLGAKIDRLLELKPNHAQAIDMANKVRVHFLQASKKRFREEKYAEALEWLSRIPVTQRDEEVEKQTRLTSELLWLQDDLKTAAVASPTLLAIANRLQKALPNSESIAKQKQRLLKQLKLGANDPRWAAPPWFAPQRTPFGCDVEQLAGFRSLDCDDTTLLKKYPGHFFTAIGLALQGIGRSASKINLLPRKQTLLNKLSFGSRQTKGPAVAWGIDLGTTALKAVKLTFDPQQPDNQPQIECLEYLPHSKPLQSNQDATGDESILAETLQTFASQHDTKGTKLCVSITHKQLLCQFIDLPSVSDKRLAEMLPHQVQHQIPFPIDEIQWDHQVLKQLDPDGDEKPASSRIMVLAARKNTLTEHLAHLEAAGLSVDILQSDCAALHSFATHEFLHSQEDSNAAVVLFDIGTNSSNVVVSSPDSAWFRSMSLGGHQVTKAIVRDFQLTEKQAEQLKATPEKAKRLSRLYETVDPVIEKLISELERNLELHAKDHPQIKITQLLCIGGGSALHGILRRMRMGRGQLAS
ncbi:MAG: hypothetical protein CL681_24005 [Blastopirellula sp.]|nr:hypothetical protein [Blastopirellula sp.]MAR13019.1 hypothetical protein [Blastopirellula sp.]